jgi:hypothetical protein
MNSFCTFRHWLGKAPIGGSDMRIFCLHGCAHLRGSGAAQGPPRDHPLDGVSPSAHLRGNSGQRTRRHRWETGVRRRCHTWYGWGFAGRGTVASRRRCSGHSALHAICARAAIQQRHTVNRTGTNCVGCEAYRPRYYCQARTNRFAASKSTRDSLPTKVTDRTCFRGDKQNSARMIATRAPLRKIKQLF